MPMLDTMPMSVLDTMPHTTTATTTTTTGTATTTTHKYYTRQEISLHNTTADCWLSWLGSVYDISNLIDHDDPLLNPILLVSGQDISHWFDKNSRDLKTQVNIQTGGKSYYCPLGRFIGIKNIMPRYTGNIVAESNANAFHDGAVAKAFNDGTVTNAFNATNASSTVANASNATNANVTKSTTNWWMDKSRKIGLVTRKSRRVRIINMLTKQENVLEVFCCINIRFGSAEYRQDLIPTLGKSGNQH
jgi:Cytochrome b5-like Heme/Steroid binding domain